ncbi:transposase [Mycobacteroides abscessus subsp. abscessus]|nr:transposase [Mycobacteroides abscessus subsp. abscessus]SIF21077.1 transposase [Mycobacteroides abscessus subsp. abscessus]SIG20140.1 transposase [Mycobacteroides abscessus subsp. abscessus]SIG54129.1 transposase [Mycobacteroides abscessus subsp. abscessus]SII18007.1 transposase [Mycobacteroides abscessus subsp. abscessus]
MDIISAYQQLGSYRAAAEQCGTTHKTVRRVVTKFEADQAGIAAPPRAERGHNYDAVTDLVAERVEKSKGRISAKRLLPIAEAAGYEGSARNFRRLVAEAKALWRRENHSGRRPAVWSPGQYLVIDWAQAAPGLFLFCAVLAFSRWRFVRFSTDQKASTTLALIAEALAAIGGVPAFVLADRMACLKGGVVANVVVPTPDYVRLAGHYGFAPDFCHASDPQSKGIVENLCGYAQDDLAVPLLTEAAVTGTPITLRAANAAAEAWCAEVNAATHSEIHAIPDERLIVERELLQPLPSLRLQIGAPSVLRKVDRLSCVRYGSARYSVPMRLIGTTVAVVVDHGALCLLEPATGMIVAEHELVAPGGTSILDDHYDGPRPTPSRGPRPKTTTEKQFCDLGEDAQAFLVGAAAIGNTRLASELEVLLALGAAHGTDALVAALHRAVAFRRFRAADVRSILAAGTGTPQPRPAGDALILDLPVAPTRSLDAYRVTPVVADGEVIP